MGVPAVPVDGHRVIEQGALPPVAAAVLGQQAAALAGGQPPQEVGPVGPGQGIAEILLERVVRGEETSFLLVRVGRLGLGPAREA